MLVIVINLLYLYTLHSYNINTTAYIRCYNENGVKVRHHSLFNFKLKKSVTDYGKLCNQVLVLVYVHILTPYSNM